MSNSIWTAKEAIKATGGKTAGGWAATGLSIDSRSVQKGDLFIALTGDNFDGHDYAAQALEKGAAAVVISSAVTGVAAEKALIVDDTFTALQDLGRYSRQRCAAKVIGITGSVGKTGTKDMLAKVFGALGQSYASQGSYNNHWGVPFSLASMHAGSDFGIFEMGMNHSSEITPLSEMAAPHIAIITTVAGVHMEHFDDVAEIAAAKAEIFDGMAAGSTAILNADNEWFDFLAGKACDKNIDVLSFGENENADARLVEILAAGNGSRIKARILDEDIAFTLLIPGQHIAMNALAVLLAVKAAGQSLLLAVKALESIQPTAGRGLREYLDIGNSNNPVTLIDESYNASPVAMKAAFKVLALVDPGRGGRRIAVLGDMLEMGEEGPREHAEMAMPLQAAGVQLVYTCGPLMKKLHESLPEELRGAHKQSSKELAQIVPEVLTPGDVVMVKGSNGSKMGVVVEALRALPTKLRKNKG